MKIQMEQERNKRGWKVTYIANEIGISKSAVTQMLNGQIKPCYDVLVKLENLFELSHRDLFEIVEEARQ